MRLKRTFLLSMWTLLGFAFSVVGSACGCAQSGELIVLDDSDGAQRSYYLYLPSVLAQPAPLLLAFHGGGSSSATAGRTMDQTTGLNALADREGFVVVYPNSLAGNWNDGRTGNGAENIPDVLFVSSLLDDVVMRTSIDTSRIYSTGMSNGGLFSQRLACDLSERIAAVYGVAATMSEELSTSCSPSRPISVGIAMGTADSILPFEGGQVDGDRGLVVSANATAEFWSEQNGCTSVEVIALDDLDTSDASSVNLSLHRRCRDGVEVDLMTIDGGGHTWPGGSQYLPRGVIGPVNRDVDMAQQLWAFVSRFRLPE